MNYAIIFDKVLHMNFPFFSLSFIYRLQHLPVTAFSSKSSIHQVTCERKTIVKKKCRFYCNSDKSSWDYTCCTKISKFFDRINIFEIIPCIVIYSVPRSSKVFYNVCQHLSLSSKVHFIYRRVRNWGDLATNVFPARTSENVQLS